MNPSRESLLLVVVCGAVGCGLMGGLLFAFSNFVMRALLLGDALYLVGTFAVTVVFNVPLNDGLAAHSADAADAAEYWRRYVSAWLNWNHVRTITSVLAAGVLAWAAGLVAQLPEV